MPAFAASSEVAASGPGGLEAEVRQGLLRAGQKTLPCKYFYDDVGTVLFEAICELPEYGLAAADARLLETYAPSMAAALPHGIAVAELGSGSGYKTRWLLEALLRRQGTLLYAPIEISPLALERCAARMAGLRGLELRPVRDEYLDGLSAIERQGPLLTLFLGSTLGNFAPGEARLFLSSVRDRLRRGDWLLLGLDLVKPAAHLHAAYDDAAGVTAAFNLNLLARLNREIGADFDLRQWQHRALYRAREQRVEMHLRSRREQAVTLGNVRIQFRRGETIWTESSHKFRNDQIAQLLGDAGFVPMRQWLDPAWPFAETLARTV